MPRSRLPLSLALLGGFLALGLALAYALGLFSDPSEPPAESLTELEHALELVAESQRQWTGLSVAPSGRIFVNFPRWSSDVPISVASLEAGLAVAWPNEEWNSWQPGKDPRRHFVCVQSVVHDRMDSLWVLDPASPSFSGVVPGGAKLLRFDASSGELLRAYPFEAPIINRSSYLNDVRIDRERGVAYMTDSGDGAIVITDLRSGVSRRLLDGHPSTQAEAVTLQIGGRPFLGPDGEPREVHADGIALSPDRKTLYYQALSGRTLYRIATSALRDASLRPEQLAARVEVLAESGASDGLICDPAGNVLVSALEEDAILAVDPRSGAVHRLIEDERICWPDSFSLGAGGTVHFTTARIHEGAVPKAPYAIYRLKPK